MLNLCGELKSLIITMFDVYIINDYFTLCILRAYNTK